MPIDLEKVPVAEAFIAAVRKFYTTDLESIDQEFIALPRELHPLALREALVMSFISQNEAMLEWSLSRGLDVDGTIGADYGLALEISDRLISRLGSDPKPHFVDLIRLAIERHGDELLTDTVTSMALSFSNKDDKIDQAKGILTRCELILGRNALSHPDCARILFKAVSERSDHQPLLWDFARRDYLIGNLTCERTILDALRAVDSKERPNLADLFEPALIKAVSRIHDLDLSEDFLLEVMPHATPKILHAFVGNVLEKVRPLRHHKLANTLLHRLSNKKFDHVGEPLQDKILDRLIGHPTFAELWSSYKPVRVVSPNLWSIRASAKLSTLGHQVSVASHSFDEIVKVLDANYAELAQDVLREMRDILKDELQMDLKKAFRTAKRDNPEPSHYLHKLNDVPGPELIDALVCLCAHEQMLQDQSKRGLEDWEAPLLAAARKNVRNPSGNPHHSMKPVFRYLIKGMDDQFKINLRPKDKKYARAMIMGGLITDAKFYSLLTAKDRESKLATDLGL